MDLSQFWTIRRTAWTYLIFCTILLPGIPAIFTRRLPTDLVISTALPRQLFTPASQWLSCAPSKHCSIASCCLEAKIDCLPDPIPVATCAVVHFVYGFGYMRKDNVSPHQQACLSWASASHFNPCLGFSRCIRTFSALSPCVSERSQHIRDSYSREYAVLASD